MLQTVQGVVLRALKYSESSIIFDLYTRQMGLQSFIVSGVRKAKSKMPAGFFQVTSMLEVVAYVKQNDSLSRVKEARPAHHYQKIPFDTMRRSIALFMAEILQKSLRDQESNELLYTFIERAFLQLDQLEITPKNHHLLFMLELSSYLGFHPNGRWSEHLPFLHLVKGVFSDRSDGMYTLTSETSKMISGCIACDFSSGTELPISRSQRQQMLEALILFYRYHLDHFKEVKTHQIFSEVLGDG